MREELFVELLFGKVTIELVLSRVGFYDYACLIVCETVYDVFDGFLKLEGVKARNAIVVESQI